MKTLLILVSCWLPLLASAAPVYRSVDSQGNVTYTSKPPTKDAKPAVLPEINRGDVRLTHKNLKTCDKRGGIDCAAGADADGSVICYDGFKDAAARFTFMCSMAKLSVADVSDISAEGGFSVFVRNSNSVAAQKPTLIYRHDKSKDMTLSGPAEIEAFGVAEFVYKPVEGLSISKKPKNSDLKLSCLNCG